MKKLFNFSNEELDQVQEKYLEFANLLKTWSKKAIKQDPKIFEEQKNGYKPISYLYEAVNCITELYQKEFGTDIGEKYQNGDNINIFELIKDIDTLELAYIYQNNAEKIRDIKNSSNGLIDLTENKSAKYTLESLSLENLSIWDIVNINNKDLESLINVKEDTYLITSKINKAIFSSNYKSGEIIQVDIGGNRSIPIKITLPNRNDKLNEWDKLVLEKIITLGKNGKIFSTYQFYNHLSGNDLNRLSPNAEESQYLELVNSIIKMGATKIEIGEVIPGNFYDEKILSPKYLGNLFSYEVVNKPNKKGTTTTFFTINLTNTLIQILTDNKNISTIKTEAYKITYNEKGKEKKLSNTKQKHLLTEFLLSRISTCRHKISNKQDIKRFDEISLDSIFTMLKNNNIDISQKQRIIEKVKIILNSFIEREYIKGYIWKTNSTIKLEF